jgi:hypothetical protein
MWRLGLDMLAIISTRPSSRSVGFAFGRFLCSGVSAVLYIRIAPIRVQGYGLGLEGYRIQ